MDGKWRGGIWGLLGLLTLFAAFSTSLAGEPEILVPANTNELDGEFCEGYFDDNNNYHIGFQCTSTEKNPDATYCCGSSTRKFCCDQGPFIGSLNIGTLVGAFVGVFVLVSLCIILCCCFCSCRFCTRDRAYVGRPHRRRSSARLISGSGIRATLMRVRRKRRAPPVPEGPRSRSRLPSQQESPPQSSYPPQSYPPNQQYPPHQQQYPLRQYPQQHYPHQDYPLNYPPNYPPQPYPHPVPRSINQSYHCEPMIPSFAAPPPPYTATSSEEHQHASPLLDKHDPAVDELPGPAYPPPSPRPMSSGQAPPLLDKQSSSAQDYPSVAYPPPSRRVAGPPSAPPPDEDFDYPRKM